MNILFSNKKRNKQNGKKVFLIFILILQVSIFSEGEAIHTFSNNEIVSTNIQTLQQEINDLRQEIKPPFRMPKSMKLCGVHIDFSDPFIYRRVKKEINSIVFNEGTLGNLVDFSGEFFPIIEPILARYKVPDDLKYLVAVESNFKIHAASYAGAKGPWQFISSAARQHGLKYNSIYDERYNLTKATEAAVKHLIGSYKLFGDWLLALTAYNKGNRGVNRILSIQGIELSLDDDENNNGKNHNGTKENENNNGEAIAQNGEQNLENFMAEQQDSNFWDLVLLVKIIRHHRIIGYRNEQERYVPRIIAMKLILENIYDYDFLKFDKRNKLKPIQTDKVIVPKTMLSVDVAKALNISLWNLKYLNPQFKGVYPIFLAKKTINLPFGLGEKFDKVKKFIKKYHIKPKHRYATYKRRKSKYKGKLPNFVKLKSGQTLWDISRYYGVPMKSLLYLNKINYRSAKYLHPGKKIRLK